MSVATSYAKALYEAARDQKTSPESLAKLEQEMDSLVSAMDSSRELRTALVGPVTTTKEKAAIAEQLSQKLSVSEITSRFAVLLARKGRFGLLPEVRDAYVSVRLEFEGGVAGSLVSAEPMSASDVDGLSQAFGRKLGRKVAFRVSTDPSLLAGVKVTVNGVTYDGTLRSQLEKLRDRFVSSAGPAQA